MGFLEFEKIKSLEMFLTDKGKERMIKQNGLGLKDLIHRFTFYDDDWDYRKTSQYWDNGVSPQPQNTSLPGSTQTLTNDLGLAIIANLQEHFVNPLTASTEWFDMTDVRGHRGRPILNCHPITGNSAFLSCTNIYAFYDVTSVQLPTGQAAKNGIDNWATNYRTNINTGWTGSVFHIPVFGERWINASYYPWHGELDTCSYNVTSTSPNNEGYTTWYGGGNQGMQATNSVYEGANSSTGFPFQVAEQDVGYGPRLFSVTGLWSGINVQSSPYLAGFGVYPPGTTTDITSNADLRGSKMEWYVTGCTMNWVEAGKQYTYYTNLSGEWDNYHIAYGEDEPDCYATSSQSSNVIPFTATPFTTLYSPWELSGTTFEDPYVQSLPSFDTTMIYSGLNFAIHYQTNYAYNLDVLCQQNCCSDDFRETGSLFGCNKCGNPFNNEVQNSTGTTVLLVNKQDVGYMWGISDPHHALTASPLTYIAITGNTNMTKTVYNCPCETFKGGDRNVLVISTTDETAVGNSNNWGGIMPLGNKTYYGSGAVNLGTPSSSIISTWGANPATATGAGDIAFHDLGYHGSGNNAAGASGGFGGASYTQANLRNAMGWDVNGVQQYGSGTNGYAVTLGPIWQPTPDWQYSQDLFMRTLPFYDTFRGFQYAAVQRNIQTYSHFLQHAYASIIGDTVPLSGLGEINLTIYGDNSGIAPSGNKSYPWHPLLALTGANPYSTLIPVTYQKPAFPYSPTTTPAWGGIDGIGTGQMVPTVDINGTPTTIQSFASATWDNICNHAGLRHYGWGINTGVGCVQASHTVSCPGPDMFSGTSFQTDLTDFITGTTQIYTGYECTYCQCLPAVFINRIGPPDPTVVDPCPDPPCGPPVEPPTVEEVGCGPLPLLSSQVRMSSYGSLLGGALPRVSSNNAMAFNTRSATEGLVDDNATYRSVGATPPPMDSLQTLDTTGEAGIWGETQQNMATTANRNARTGLVVDMNAILQPYSYQYNDETYIDYDIVFNSETYIGNTKVVKGQVKFKWIIDSGLKTFLIPGFKPQLKACKKVDVTEVKKKAIPGDLEPFTYLNGIRNKEEGHYWKYEEDEYCVTLAVEIDGKIQIKTKRIRIIGNKFNGWRINWLST